MSKLPPRTEAWWDAEAERTICVTCERYHQVPVPEVPVSDAPVVEAPVVEAPVSEVPVVEAVAGADPAATPTTPTTPTPASPAPVTDPAILATLPPPPAPTVAARTPAAGTAAAPADWLSWPAGDQDATATPEAHHVTPGPEADAGPEQPVDDRSAIPPVTSIVGRTRGAVDVRTAPTSARPEWPFERVSVSAPMPGELGPDQPPILFRGDMGEGRVGQTLEGARVHGLEVLHGLPVPGSVDPIDHLVVAVNGVWLVHAEPTLKGRLERRDLGDWFSADLRLYVADEDRSGLIAGVRTQMEAVSAMLADTAYSDVPVRGVVCFGSVQPGWVTEPFVINGVSVTWRPRLVEPFLDPVLLDLATRTALVHLLAGSAVLVGSPGYSAGAADPSRHAAG